MFDDVTPTCAAVESILGTPLHDLWVTLLSGRAGFGMQTQSGSRHVKCTLNDTPGLLFAHRKSLTAEGG